ncbi:hypothetical protein RRF57_004465 [Xylaria bambusicola]|uniref:Uncharacterized protein n=1 Tax=Xylaria bambusicola TaxID=326684 RepID=A0AAN7UAP2_9PEZI
MVLKIRKAGARIPWRSGAHVSPGAVPRSSSSSVQVLVQPVQPRDRRHDQPSGSDFQGARILEADSVTEPFGL